MSQSIYPYDPTGLASTNLVQNEQHTTTEANFRDYLFIVPQYAPFFAEGLIVQLNTGTDTVTLIEGEDYSPALVFVGATRSLGKPVYGAISLNNTNLIGIVSITYQTLGGEWVADQQQVLVNLSEMNYNPRLTIWDNVTNVTNEFPPNQHYNDVANAYGMVELVNAILALVETTPSMMNQLGIVRHLTNYDNPHKVTPAQIGLGNLGNWPMATNDQAIAGISNDTIISPSTLKAVVDMINSGIGGDINGIQSILNSINASISDIRNELTTTEQLISGHIADHNNPHQDNKAQVGLSDVANLPLADISEVLALEHVDKYITLNQLLTLLETQNMSGGGGSTSGYGISLSSNTVDEGNSITATVTATGVADGTVLYWDILNATTSLADFVSSSGMLTINSNTGTFTVDVILDGITEPTEYCYLRVRTGSNNGPIVATSTIISVNNVDTASTFSIRANDYEYTPSSTIRVNVGTTNVPDGIVLYWTINHITTTSGDFSNTVGTVTINGGTGSFDISVLPERIDGPNEKFIIQLHTVSASGTVVASTPVLYLRRNTGLINMLNNCCIFSPEVSITPESIFIMTADRQYSVN